MQSSQPDYCIVAFANNTRIPDNNQKNWDKLQRTKICDSTIEKQWDNNYVLIKTNKNWNEQLKVEIAVPFEINKNSVKHTPDNWWNKFEKGMEANEGIKIQKNEIKYTVPLSKILQQTGSLACSSKSQIPVYKVKPDYEWIKSNITNRHNLATIWFDSVKQCFIISPEPKYKHIVALNYCNNSPVIGARYETKDESKDFPKNDTLHFPCYNDFSYELKISASNFKDAAIKLHYTTDPELIQVRLAPKYTLVFKENSKEMGKFPIEGCDYERKIEKELQDYKSRGYKEIDRTDKNQTVTIMLAREMINKTFTVKLTSGIPIPYTITKWDGEKMQGRTSGNPFTFTDQLPKNSHEEDFKKIKLLFTAPMGYQFEGGDKEKNISGTVFKDAVPMLKVEKIPDFNLIYFALAGEEVTNSNRLKQALKNIVNTIEKEGGKYIVAIDMEDKCMVGDNQYRNLLYLLEQPKFNFPNLKNGYNYLIRNTKLRDYINSNRKINIHLLVTRGAYTNHFLYKNTLNDFINNFGKTDKMGKTVLYGNFAFSNKQKGIFYQDNNF